ncbi:6-phosphofructokinase [Paraburkholderia caballeronis]|uniref:1-phosphofructokinase family hexose kinase n=1 Tax=Paraburkholderia caballeronis TaxID=416943 RepID=UPI001065936B|nr:1-phosphofructokinase family hexose kinase [Paraburkholderia caballeronis]TDV33994.1 6-phosphofructokinase [Paraburkholderia caballeronis]
MTGIVTVTLNPAIDVATSVAQVTDTHKLRCACARRDPGGGGINVARVIRRLGGDCVALYLAGGAVGQMLQRMLDSEQVRSACIGIAGDTRENFSVRETTTGREYRFVLPGPVVGADEWARVLRHGESLDPPPRYLVLSGSLPPGLPDDAYANLARIARARGARVVLDTSGPALKKALNERVFLVKPSLSELRELTGAPLETEDEWRDAAARIVRDGRAEVVALTLGERGAMVVAAGLTLRADALPMAVSSAIGAGDSFVGAMVWALDRGDALDVAFRHAVAAASATLLAQGTALCRPDDQQRLYRVLQDQPLHDSRAGPIPATLCVEASPPL